MNLDRTRLLMQMVDRYDISSSDEEDDDEADSEEVIAQKVNTSGKLTSSTVSLEEGSASEDRSPSSKRALATVEENGLSGSAHSSHASVSSDSYVSPPSDGSDGEEEMSFDEEYEEEIFDEEDVDAGALDDDEVSFEEEIVELTSSDEEVSVEGNEISDAQTFLNSLMSPQTKAKTSHIFEDNDESDIDYSSPKKEPTAQQHRLSSPPQQNATAILSDSGISTQGDDEKTQKESMDWEDALVPASSPGNQKNQNNSVRSGSRSRRRRQNALDDSDPFASPRSTDSSFDAQKLESRIDDDPDMYLDDESDQDDEYNIPESGKGFMMETEPDYSQDVAEGAFVGIDRSMKFSTHSNESTRDKNPSSEKLSQKIERIEEVPEQHEIMETHTSSNLQDDSSVESPLQENQLPRGFGHLSSGSTGLEVLKVPSNIDAVANETPEGIPKAENPKPRSAVAILEARSRARKEKNKTDAKSAKSAKKKKKKKNKAPTPVPLRKQPTAKKRSSTKQNIFSMVQAAARDNHSDSDGRSISSRDSLDVDPTDRVEKEASKVNRPTKKKKRNNKRKSKKNAKETYAELSDRSFSGHEHHSESDKSIGSDDEDVFWRPSKEGSAEASNLRKDSSHSFDEEGEYAAGTQGEHSGAESKGTSKTPSFLRLLSSSSAERSPRSRKGINRFLPWGGKKKKSRQDSVSSREELDELNTSSRSQSSIASTDENDQDPGTEKPKSKNFLSWPTMPKFPSSSSLDKQILEELEDERKGEPSSNQNILRRPSNNRGKVRAKPKRVSIEVSDSSSSEDEGIAKSKRSWWWGKPSSKVDRPLKSMDNESTPDKPKSKVRSEASRKESESKMTKCDKATRAELAEEKLLSIPVHPLKDPSFNEQQYLKKKQAHEASGDNTTVGSQRETRMRAYQEDTERRESMKIQSAFRGYLARKEHDPALKKGEEKKKKTNSKQEEIQARRHNPASQSYAVEPQFDSGSSPKKNKRWLVWNTKKQPVSPLKEKDREHHTRPTLKRHAAFDRSLYLRRRMYQDEHGDKMKTLAEVREERQEMYLRDLERRETIKLQSVARGYLTRRRFAKETKPKSKRLSKKKGKIERVDKLDGKSRKGNNGKKTNKQSITKRARLSTPTEEFDRASYLRERLQKEEYERQMMTMEDVRLERRRVYVLDLERREATRIQAAARGFMTRKRYPMKSRKKDVSSHQEVRLSVDVEEPKKPKSIAGMMKQMFFGKSKTKEKPSTPDAVIQERAPSSSLLEVSERKDASFMGPSETVDADFFGFDDPKYKERNGYFAYDKSQHLSDSQGYTEAGRNWKGRKSQFSTADFDKSKYWKEWQEREAYEAKVKEEQVINERKIKERKEAARLDRERREALKIQAALRGYNVRKKLPKKKDRKAPQKKSSKKKTSKEAPKNPQKKLNSKSTRESEVHKSLMQLAALKTNSSKTSGEEKGTLQLHADSDKSSPGKGGGKLSTNGEEPTGRQSNEPRKVGPLHGLAGGSSATGEAIPSGFKSTKTKGSVSENKTESSKPVEVVNLEGSDEIIVEPTDDNDEMAAERRVTPKSSKTEQAKRNAHELRSVPREGSEKTRSTKKTKAAGNVNGKNVSPKSVAQSQPNDDKPIEPVVLSDYKSKAPVHTGMTHSTTVGDTWWLPSIGTEDARGYREDVYVPKTTKSYARRPERVSTTSYWEAVRDSYLPSHTGITIPAGGSNDDDSYVPSVKVQELSQSSRVSSQAGKSIDKADGELSWLPPGIEGHAPRQKPSPLQQQEDSADAWVPLASKPLPKTQRVDFSGAVQEESFRWAPHLPQKPSGGVDQETALSRSTSTGRVKKSTPASKGKERRVVRSQAVSDPVDLEMGIAQARSAPETETTAMSPKQTRCRRALLIMAVIWLLVVAGAVTAYFLWEDPPW